MAAVVHHYLESVDRSRLVERGEYRLFGHAGTVRRKWLAITSKLLVYLPPPTELDDDSLVDRNAGDVILQPGGRHLAVRISVEEDLVESELYALRRSLLTSDLSTDPYSAASRLRSAFAVRLEPP